MRILSGFSRRRLFGLSIASSAIPLALIALIPNLVVVVVLVVLLARAPGWPYVNRLHDRRARVDDDTRAASSPFSTPLSGSSCSP